MRIPSVVALKSYVSTQNRPPFTRFNLYLRDSFSCQYCGAEGFIPGYREGTMLTLDHVFPKSRGGHLGWENTVAACAPCNVRKADRTPDEAGMRLMRAPHHPTQRELLKIARQYPTHAMHETWLQFLQLEEIY